MGCTRLSGAATPDRPCRIDAKNNLPRKKGFVAITGANFDYNPDNSARYSAILQGYQNQLANYQQNAQQVQQMYANMSNLYSGYGGAQQTALAKQYAANQAQAQQSLISRGLGNTTTLDASNRGINYDYANSLQNLNNNLIQGQLGIMGQAAGTAQTQAQDISQLQGLPLQAQTNLLNQKYGIEAQYGASAALQGQNAVYGVNNQSYLNQQNFNNQMIAQQQQQAYQNSYASNYGY